MSKIKIGINGIGRIGRAVARHALNSDDFEICAFNDINPEIDNIAYLLEYDTIYGRLNQSIEVAGDNIHMGNNKIKVFHKQDIMDVPWEDLGVDYVIESSGVASNLESIQSKKNTSGVKQFVVTHAPNGDLQTVIFGVNEEDYDPKINKVASSSICDTVALAPILKVLEESHKIESGFLTTLHPWLSYQNLVDGPSVSWSQPGDIFSHYALGRASTQNLIPKSTSAVRAADAVFPGLSEKLQSFSYRVPTPVVTSSVLILYLDQAISKEALIERFHAFEENQSHKVIKNSVRPLTAVDYTGEEHSVIIDHRWTKVEKEKHLKLVYWYDNEWGYSARVIDLLRLAHEKS